MKKRGFTLIELLVVIAIIGILAGIVLVSVGTARNKAKDVAVKANLANMRAAGELYNDRLTTYAGFCISTASDGGQRSMNETDRQAETAAAGCAANGTTGCADCNDIAAEWAACGALTAATPAADWCVDSIGNSKSIPNGTCVDAWAATACPL